mgnify:CR=1 FL=1
MAQYNLSYAPKWIKSATVNPGDVAANSYLDVTLASSFKPAKVNDIFLVVAPALEGGLVIGPGIVTTAGTVTMRITNATAAPINPASQTFIGVGL